MPDYSNIRREFPDFPLESIPEGIPNWLIPLPWHNDTCPVWGDEPAAAGEGGIQLAIDYPDQEQRELGSPDRFSVWTTDVGGEQVGDTFTSDDWDAVLAELRRRADLPC